MRHLNGTLLNSKKMVNISFEIKAKDSDGKIYNTPTIKLVFNVSPEDKPEETVYSTIDITDDKFGGVFSNEGQPENTYKYTGKFKTDTEGIYTADFSSFPGSLLLVKKRLKALP